MLGNTELGSIFLILFYQDTKTLTGGALIPKKPSTLRYSGDGHLVLGLIINFSVISNHSKLPMVPVFLVEWQVSSA